MIIFPAIDIKDGKCVRLRQGKAEDSRVFFDDPLEAAALWMGKGARFLHVVNLDGAFNGSLSNLDIIAGIKESTGAFVQVGGGIRDRESIKSVLDSNIDRAILGTAALNDRGLVEWAVAGYGERIAVSVDALDNKVAFHGWTGVSEVDVESMVGSLVDIGVKTFICTDISRDGMMSGPDMSGIKRINDMFGINVIASGGVTTLDDVRTLKDMGIYGAIIGKALYEGSISLEEAMEVSECS